MSVLEHWKRRKLSSVGAGQSRWDETVVGRLGVASVVVQLAWEDNGRVALAAADSTVVSVDAWDACAVAADMGTNWERTVVDIVALPGPSAEGSMADSQDVASYEVAVYAAHKSHHAAAEAAWAFAHTACGSDSW